MQTLHLTGINKLLHPERDKRSATERIFDHLSHSNIGLNRGEATALRHRRSTVFLSRRISRSFSVPPTA